MCVFLSFCEIFELQLPLLGLCIYYFCLLFLFCYPSIFFFLRFRNNNTTDLWKFAITTSTWLGLVLILGTCVICDLLVGF